MEESDQTLTLFFTVVRNTHKNQLTLDKPDKNKPKKISFPSITTIKVQEKTVL